MFNRSWIICLLFIPATIFAIPDLSLEVHHFRSTESSFAEVSIYIVGSSLVCTPGVSEFYGVEYTILIQNDNGKIATGNRYKLTNTGCSEKDLIDVKRFLLAPGNYSVDVEMTDVHDNLNTITVSQQILIEASPVLSDVQLLSVIKAEPAGDSPLHKSGMYLEPLPFRYYYPSLDMLSIYFEAYETEKLEGQPYVQYTLKPLDGDIPSPLVTHRKVLKQSIAPNIFQLDISALISGPYVLETILFDGHKKMITSKTIAFSRYNPVGDSIFIHSGSLNLDASFIKKITEDSLDYYMRAMAPVVSSIQNDILNTLVKKGNVKSKQFFIHQFWTGEAGKYADQAFEAYMSVAKIIDAKYRSGFGYGFETDRGHVFLKYGRPDDVIEVEDEPSAPPYEIWFYNDFPATHQSNVRFLFYNPTLVRNGFTLLHSTAIGETKNPRWEVELYKDATLETPGVKENLMGDNVHRNARKYFENY